MRTKWILLGFAVVFVGLFLLNARLQPRKISREPSFEAENFDPFGSQAFFTLLPDFFPGAKIDRVNDETFTAFFDTLYPTPKTYLIVNTEYAPDEYDVESLRYFASDGNTVFLAAHRLSVELEDSIGIRIGSFARSDTLILSFSDLRRLKRDTLAGTAYTYRISLVDSSGFEVLVRQRNGTPVLVRKQVGDGWIYLSTLPYLFTNQALLVDDRAGLLGAMLSYLPPDQDILWDTYYKMPKILARMQGDGGGGLSWWLAQPALRVAFFVGLTALLLFVVFGIKRRQRVIPLFKPKPNLTLDFAETIARLYRQRGDHGHIARQRIAQWLRHIREHYGISTETLDDAFIRQLAARASAPTELLRHLIRLNRRLDRQGSFTEAQLLELNEALENFYAK